MYTYNYMSNYTFINIMRYEYLYEYLYLVILTIIRIDIWVVIIGYTYNYMSRCFILTCFMIHLGKNFT